MNKRTRSNILVFILSAVVASVPSLAYTQGLPPDSLWVGMEDAQVFNTNSDNGQQSNGLLRTTLYVSGAAAITAGLIHYDQQMYSTLYLWRQRSAPLSAISPMVTNLGNGTLSFGLFGGYLGYGIIFDNERATRVGKIGLESFAVSGIAVQIMKYIFGREQPNVATRSGGSWNGPLSYFRRNPGTSKGIASYDAFPSGHTTTVFAAATVLADMYDEPWVGYASYSLASVVAISRVMERTHWVSDCFVGGLIGFLATRSVEKMNSFPSNLTFGPTDFRHAYGVKLTVVM